MGASGVAAAGGAGAAGVSVPPWAKKGGAVRALRAISAICCCSGDRERTGAAGADGREGMGWPDGSVADGGGWTIGPFGSA